MRLITFFLLISNLAFCQNFKDDKLLVDLSSVVHRLQKETGNIIYTSPDSLSFALTKLKPGQHLILKEGHYSNVNFAITVSGTPIAPIVISAYGKVDIDCLNGVLIKGSDITLEGLKLYTDSWTGDRFTTAQRFDVSIEGARTTIRNCIIHDFGNNGLWSNAPGSHIEGCLFYNTGRGGTSQGHSLYTQNAEGTMVIKNNIFLAGNYNSTFNLHLYGSGGARGLRGYVFNHNIFFGGRNLMGSAGTKLSAIDFINNVIISGNLEIGSGATDPPHEINADGNRMWDANFNIKKVGVLNLTHTLATFPSGTANGNIVNILAGNIDYNRYRFYGRDPYNRYNENNVIGQGGIALQMIKDKTPFEAHSTEELYFGIAPPNEIDVNLYQTDRANVAIANYSLLNNVNVSFPGMDMGSYRAYNAQNPKEWFDFDFVGAAISFPMTGWTVSPPIGTAGGAMVQTSTMFPKFGIFYITKKP